jgi:hypothetical protein
MKYLIAFTLLTSSYAFAQVCKSSLVYQAYNTCPSLENGLKWDEAKVVIPAGAPQISTTQGGHNLDNECEKIRKVYDRNDDQNHMAFRGHITDKTELKPVEHRSDVGNLLLSVDYKYACTVEVQQVPYGVGPAKACGIDPIWLKADAGYERVQIAGQAKCLSCDGINDPSRALACIADSVEQVIEPQAVPLDPQDISAVQATVNELIRYQRVYKAFGLTEANQLAEISDKLEAVKPAQGETR